MGMTDELSNIADPYSSSHECPLLKSTALLAMDNDYLPKRSAAPVDPSKSRDGC